MLGIIAITPLNHLLRAESWAPRRLQLFAGKTARFSIPPLLDLAVKVEASGELSETARSIAADVVLTIDPALVPRLLAPFEDVSGEIRVSGDPAFAAEILHIGKNLRWDVEQDLSGILGDILAHRLARAGNSLINWHTGAVVNLSRTLAEYWTEEQPLLVKPSDMHCFSHTVNLLQNDANRLEERVKALEHIA
jgi:ubiquinone biosynthesis accessory factor UbiJ